MRTAITLAAEVERLNERVEALAQQVQGLQFEWTDVLDKLLAREERWRKRYKAEVDRGLTDGAQISQAAPVAAIAGDRKSRLRVQLEAAKQQRSGGY